MRRTLARRTLLLGGLAAAAGAPSAVGRLTGALARPSLDYEPLAHLPPFRRLALAGDASLADAALLGIADPSTTARRATAEAAAWDAPCVALFGGWPEDGSLPIAYFASFQCPYCRILEPELDALVERERGRVRLVHRELPIFGPASELAARRALRCDQAGS